jgi:hypothetical protein
MLIIGENRSDLRNFFDGDSSKIIGPVIRVKPGLILQTGCPKQQKKQEEC